MPETTIILGTRRYDIPRTNVPAGGPSEGIEKTVQEGESDRLITSREELEAEKATGGAPLPSRRLGHFENVLYRKNGKIYNAAVWTTESNLVDKIV